MTRMVPVLFGSFAGYRARWIPRDVVAGLTVWAVLVPESLAYATIAGVSPVVGLYAAVPALVLYAAVGSSRHLVVGIAVSMTLLLYRASRPHVTRLVRSADADRSGLWVDADRHLDLHPQEGIVVVRVESGLFFANADHIRDRIRTLAATGATAVVLDGETTPFIDVTAAGMLDQLTRDLAAHGVRLYFARDIGQVRDVLHHTGNGSGIVIYPDIDAAVTAAREHSTRPAN